MFFENLIPPLATETTINQAGKGLVGKRRKK